MAHINLLACWKGSGGSALAVVRCNYNVDDLSYSEASMNYTVIISKFVHKIFSKITLSTLINCIIYMNACN